MKYILVSLLCLQVILAVQVSIEKKIVKQFLTKSKKDLFKVYHLVFNKKYDLASEEAKKRFKIFKQNMKEIEEFNNQKGNTYEKGIGPFTDLTKEEFIDQYLMKPELLRKLREDYLKRSKAFLTEEDDDDLTLRNLQLPSNFTAINFTNALPPVKNQQQCGSCWAFATIGPIEKNYYDCNNNQVISLSEQFLVDCAKDGNLGCDGGLGLLSFIWVQSSSNGVPKTSDYPQAAINGTCKDTSKFTNYQVKGRLYSCGDSISNTTICDPNIFLNLAQRNVISVGVTADNWGNYNEGIYNDTTPLSTQPDHAVIVVGVGINDNNPYYILRNSWGTGWGIGGYMFFGFTPGVTNSLTQVGIYFENQC